MVSVPSREQSPSGIVVVVLALWFCLAVAVGYSGLLRNVAASAIPAIIAALTFLALLVCWQNPSLLGLEMRWLVGLHLTRFVGIYFLLLARRGDIPRRWAVPAGIGDIAIAIGALLLVVSGIRWPSCANYL